MQMGWWIPDRIENSFAQIQPEQLKAKGIRLVLADLDNTLTRYQQPDPDDQVKHWRTGCGMRGSRYLWYPTADGLSGPSGFALSWRSHISATRESRTERRFWRQCSSVAVGQRRQ